VKGLFPEYEEPSRRDYPAIWKHGQFIFDANVLLSLFRYQTATRDELLKIIGQLSDRIWIPYQVALEFQRNRVAVLAEQTKRFFDVRAAVEKSRVGLRSEIDKLQLGNRHSLINPQPLLAGFESLTGEFLSHLDRQYEAQQKISDRDPLKEQIENLFDKKVGAPPKDQSELDSIYKEAESRYEFRIPPGYEDRDKDKKEPDECSHRGLIYKRKYGDYLMWVQILRHAREDGIKHLIFVTDDRKEDWWQKVEVDGPKTVGRRPELAEEARLKASVDSFLMYSPEEFLKFAKEFLKAQVSDETLNDVREMSATQDARGDRSAAPNEEESLKRARVVARALLDKLYHANPITLPDAQIVSDTIAALNPLITALNQRRIRLITGETHAAVDRKISAALEELILLKGQLAESAKRMASLNDADADVDFVVQNAKIWP
jgi:hypothetical protein